MLVDEGNVNIAAGGLSVQNGIRVTTTGVYVEAGGLSVYDGMVVESDGVTVSDGVVVGTADTEDGVVGEELLTGGRRVRTGDHVGKVVGWGEAGGMSTQ